MPTKKPEKVPVTMRCGSTLETGMSSSPDPYRSVLGIVGVC
jgi:hypothetical protein